MLGALLERADGADRVAGQAGEVFLSEGGRAAPTTARKTGLLQRDLAAAVAEKPAQVVGPASAVGWLRLAQTAPP
jgi:hypothetical protein